MKIRYNFAILILLYMAAPLLTSAQNRSGESSISFQVSFAEPQAHYAEIQMEIKGIARDYVDVKMPVWTPGSYLVREYSRHVEQFEACEPSGNHFRTEKVSKNTWRIHTGGQEHIVVNYRIYGFEVSVRTNFIDDSHAFLSPAATFMYVDGLIDHPTQVTVVPHRNWSKISTGLEPVEGLANTFYAEDFDILFDSPIEVGNQDVFTFEASNVLHEVAMVGGGNYNKEQLIADFTILIEECTRIFGVNPNKRYVFIVHNYKNGRGGLEHLNSTVLMANRNGYTNSRTYSSFLSLVAHEYFHLWFVKRIRPIELGPFNYDAENYTTGLWIMEGFTSYFDNLILRRTGLVTESAYLQLLSQDFEAIENKGGNDVQPVALASFDAWIKYYRPDENTSNSSISYYNKGALLAMLMDVKIIQETNGKFNLDEVMKAAYQEFYVEKQRGFREDEFEALIERVTGVSVSEIFRMAHTVEEIPYNDYLKGVGYELVDLNAGNSTPDLGISTQMDNGRVIVSAVTRASSAWDAGINVRDEIISINGDRVEVAGRELSNSVQHHQVGDVLNVLISRDGIIREINLTLKADAQHQFTIRRLQNASKEQIKLGERWLSL